MKNVTELFDKYAAGTLADDLIEEMNRLLIEAWFSGSPDLSEEAKTYAEDLVMELHSKNELEERFAGKFRERLSHDIHLNEKYFILKKVFHPAVEHQTEAEPAAGGKESTEAQEEEALKAVLQEVLEKVHEEEKAATSPVWMDTLAARLKNFFRELFAPFFVIQPQSEPSPSPVYVLRPQVKAAFAFVSLSGLALIVWFSVTRNPAVRLAENITSDTLIENQVIAGDSGNMMKQPEIIDFRDPVRLPVEHLAKNEQPAPGGEIKLNEVETPQLAEIHDAQEELAANAGDQLLASLYAPPGIEFLLNRGDFSDAVMLLADAARKYNTAGEPPDYKGCISILQPLVDANAFTTRDTLDIVNYFLGSCYLKTGIDEDNAEKVTLALAAFNRISPEFEKYPDVRWYVALASLKLGLNDESFRLADSLVRANYLRMGDVELLRDSLLKIISIPSGE
ncbi:MAG: hypothetical protein KBC43_08330 [Bacteroidales bacterium]|nr:hypothetical protein [Bacteroidales bacterium]